MNVFFNIFILYTILKHRFHPIFIYYWCYFYYYFVSIIIYRIHDGKEAIVIFLYKFKLDYKAAIHNINSVFGQGTVNERTMQCWFQEFLHEDENFEDESCGRPSAVDNDKLKVLVEADPCITI